MNEQNSRSQLRREALQKGETMPTFDDDKPCASAQGANDMSDRLTELIERTVAERCVPDTVMDCICGHTSNAERDEIVLGLRLLRVLRETANASRTTGVRLSETTEEIRVDVEHEDHSSWGVTIDTAERLLGYGGGE